MAETATDTLVAETGTAALAAAMATPSAAPKHHEGALAAARAAWVLAPALLLEMAKRRLAALAVERPARMNLSALAVEIGMKHHVRAVLHCKCPLVMGRATQTSPVEALGCNLFAAGAPAGLPAVARRRRAA